MADKEVDFNATNRFSMGANFHAQSSTAVTMRDPANIRDADGNVECETMINERTDVSTPWAYCNATPAIGTDLSTFATQFGNVQNSLLVTGLEINFEAGAYATGSTSGHNHTDNAHAAGVSIGYADVSGAIPDSSGFGVPSFGIVLGTNATPISATLSFSMQHVDKIDTDGDHWVGKNLTPRAELSVTLQGVPTSVTAAALEAGMTGWTVDSNGYGDANDDGDTYVVTAHRHFDLAAA